MNISIRSFSLISLLLVASGQGVVASSLDHKNNEPPQRIVSAGGSITEILFALGANLPNQHHVVATDTSSSFPQAAQDLPKVGYYRQLSVEGVLSVNPSSVFAAKGAGPVDALKQLEQSGVDLVLFEQARTVSGLLKLIDEVGEHSAQTSAATQLKTALQSQLARAQQRKIQEDLPVVFLMSASQRGLMAAGSNTVPHLIMELAGLSNPYAELQGFKNVSVESLLDIAPKHVLIAAHTSNGLSAQQICQQPGLKLWAQTYGCNVHLVDSLLFLGMTPRLPQAVENFINMVAPQNMLAPEQHAKVQ